MHQEEVVAVPKGLDHQEVPTPVGLVRENKVRSSQERKEVPAEENLAQESQDQQIMDHKSPKAMVLPNMPRRKMVKPLSDLFNS